jgi:opacity protein-like surface antigen
MKTTTRVMALLAVFLLSTGLIATKATGQSSEVRSIFGVDFSVSRPTGEFRQHVGTGYGFDSHLVLGGPIAVRTDLGIVQYGSQSSLLCYSHSRHCDALVNVSTHNTVSNLALGPQITANIAGIWPYAHAGIGVSHFATATRVTGAYSDKVLNEVWNQGSFVLSWTSGAGVMIPLMENWDSALVLNLGVRYHRNGEAEYMRAEDLRQRADGTISGSVTRSEANFLSFRIGVSLGR